MYVCVWIGIFHLPWLRDLLVSSSSFWKKKSFVAKICGVGFLDKAAASCNCSRVRPTKLSKMTSQPKHMILEFDSDVDISSLVPGTTLDIDNMESGKPIIKTKHSVFVGEIKDVFGTSMIFRKDKDSSNHKLIGMSSKNVAIRNCFKRNTDSVGEV